MACFYPEDCEQFTVCPMLVVACPTRCCEDPPMCYPCLPRCPSPKVMYCSEKKPRVSRPPICQEEDRCEPPPKCKSRSTPEAHKNTSTPDTCVTCSECKPVKTKYVIPCYRYEDGRIVRKLPVSAFKRNGMQDQEHSKTLGTANFLFRSPRDVVVECELCTDSVKVSDPAKVPPCTPKPILGCCLLKKKPIKVSLEDILDD